MKHKDHVKLTCNCRGNLFAQHRVVVYDEAQRMFGATHGPRCGHTLERN
jgi:hypothetical protein